MNRRPLLIGGAAALAAWLLLLLLDPHAALLGWLVAFLAFASVPIGCLSLLMMTILVPGSWRKLYSEPLWTGASLLPVAALAMLPVLFGLWTLYPWASGAAHFSGFKGAWLSSGFFIARQLAYWAILIGLWLALLRFPAKRLAIAAGGLIAFALTASWIGIDVAETLAPQFHSSIYGLLILGGEWVAGIAFALALALPGGRGRAPVSAAGALIVAILMWSYFHAMQFLVIWSGNLPDEVVWYLARGTGAWAVATAILYLAQGLGPFFAMLAPAVRDSRRAMTIVALVSLGCRPLESAWLLLPGNAVGWKVLASVLVALAAMAALGAGAAIGLQSARIRRSA